MCVVCSRARPPCPAANLISSAARLSCTGACGASCPGSASSRTLREESTRAYRRFVSFIVTVEDTQPECRVQFRRFDMWSRHHQRAQENLRERIAKLSPEELKKFRAWFAEFDARAWDAQTEQDSKAGKLDAMVAEVVEEYKAGKTRPL